MGCVLLLLSRMDSIHEGPQVKPNVSLIVLAKQAITALDIVGRVRRVVQAIQRIALMSRRLEELEKKLEAAAKKLPIKIEQKPSPFRKCPRCGERDFRLIDAYRIRPDVFGERILHQKWLCYNCSHREEDNLEEPD